MISIPKTFFMHALQGKISREDVADLCVALLGCPAAACTTFEVRSTVPFSQPWTGPQGGTAAAGDVPRRVREWQVSCQYYGT